MVRYHYLELVVPVLTDTSKFTDKFVRKFELLTQGDKILPVARPLC